MNADEYLESKGIEFEIVIQDEPTKSCDDAARERGLETRQIVKSLIIESGGEKYHVLLPGDRTLSENKFGSEYRLVPPEESKELTGFESGTVHPFSTELRHVVDERVFENDRVSHTVGEKKRGVILDSEEFRKALKSSGFEFRIKDIAVSTEEDFKEMEKEGLERDTAKFVVNNGYRSLFHNLSAKYQNEQVVDFLEEMNRNNLELELEIARKVIERAEDQTHMQRLLDMFAENGELPEEKRFDLGQAVSNILENNPDAVEDYSEGKDSALNFLIGRLMQETNGKADAGKARKLILEELG